MKNKSDHTPLSRKSFLRLAAASLGALVGSPLLSACDQVFARGPTSTPMPTATATSIPTATVPPTPTSRPIPPLPEIVRIYPAVSSRVVQTHHSGVWSDKQLVPNVLRQMLDASITKLTGLNDAQEAWKALFRPNERIAIKVNAFSNSIIWTHVPLVTAVTQALQEAGIPPEQIVLYDLFTHELETAGYPINPDGPGVRCYGSDNLYNTPKVRVMGVPISLSDSLTGCDALINMPVLKAHMMAGITFAMKNHYGSYKDPLLLHGVQMKEVAALNALPEIKNRTRLIIGDALAANLKWANSWPYWKEDWVGDSIFMSFDPAAHDTLGLKLLTSELDKIGGNSQALVRMAEPALIYAAELGVGTNDPAQIDFVETRLS